MRDGPGRRDWLLGLVGVIFGTKAAAAVDRLLPGAKREPLGGVELEVWVRHPDGSLTSWSGPVEGRMVVECDDAEGLFRVSVTGRGDLTAGGEVAEVTLRRTGRLGRRHPQTMSTRYEGAKFREGEPLSVTTYTYDASRPLS